MTGCAILQLPNEVLEEIISEAAAWPDSPADYGLYVLYADRWALTLVCRRFHVLAQPILYSRIALGPVHPRIDGAQSDVSAARLGDSIGSLLHTLQQKPNLAARCTELALDIRACCEHLKVLCTVIAALVATRSLRIRHGFRETEYTATWACLAMALANMPQLEHLSFAAGRTPMNMQHILAMLSSSLTAQRYPSIKELELDGVNRSLLPVRVELWNPSQPAPFTKLTLSDYHERPETIRVLLSAPSRLEHFAYSGIRRFGYHPLDLRTLWSYLVPHARTLETLRVGSLSHQTPQTPLAGQLAGVDFAPFERLRSLSLSYWATGSDGGEEVYGLLAPRLETFEWTFDGDDGRPLSLDHFGEEEEEFLRRLAKGAAARGLPLTKLTVVYTPTTTAPLKTNSLLFTMLGLDLAGAIQEREYPWDRMDRLAEELREQRIEFKYNEPSISRKTFQEAAQAFRRALTLKKSD